MEIKGSKVQPKKPALYACWALEFYKEFMQTACDLRIADGKI